MTHSRPVDPSSLSNECRGDVFASDGNQCVTESLFGVQPSKKIKSEFP